MPFLAQILYSVIAAHLKNLDSFSNVTTNENQNEIHVNTLVMPLFRFCTKKLQKVIFLSQITQFQVDVHFNLFEFKE